jgi:hypothetical protein
MQDLDQFFCQGMFARKNWRVDGIERKLGISVSYLFKKIVSFLK